MEKQQFKPIRDQIYEWAYDREWFTVPHLEKVLKTSNTNIWKHIYILIKEGRVVKDAERKGKVVKLRVVKDVIVDKCDAPAWEAVDVNLESVSDILRRLGPLRSVHIAHYIDHKTEGVETVKQVRKILFDNPQAFYCRGDEWGVRKR